MADQAVRDWLADYKMLTAGELNSFASTICQNVELIGGIFSVLEDKVKYSEFLEPVCHQLFSFYRSQIEDLQRFTLQYLPTLIAVHLSSLGNVDRKVPDEAAAYSQNMRSVEVLLLGIYNLVTDSSSSQKKVQRFRVPSLSHPSVYHEPMSLISASMTESALSRLEKIELKSVTSGPHPQVENLNAQNRLKVMTVLMDVYNSHLSLLPKASLQALCKMCTRIAKQGYHRVGHYQRSSYGNEPSYSNNPYMRPIPRVQLTSAFLLELLHGVYYAIFNGHATLGLQAIDDVHFRAVQELMPEVLLVTNAVRSSSRLNNLGQLTDGPMGISVALSPSSSASNVAKNIITNASFRTKKLPDDIPIQASTAETEADGKPLAPISEETPATPAPEESGRANSFSKGKEKGPILGIISKMEAKLSKKDKGPDEAAKGKRRDSDSSKHATRLQNGGENAKLIMDGGGVNSVMKHSHDGFSTVNLDEVSAADDNVSVFSHESGGLSNNEMTTLPQRKSSTSTDFPMQTSV